MQTNATQIARAIAQLYTLTGSFDVPGGNVLFPPCPRQPDVAGGICCPPGSRAKRARPAGAAAGAIPLGFVTSDEIYRGILEQQPYAVRGLVGFGANLLLSHADGLRGREALAALDFYVHADLFMNPTAELADVVLPVASAFEREALKIGFEVSAEAQALVQLRQPVVAPRARPAPTRRSSSTWPAAWGWAALLGRRHRGRLSHQLGPSGMSLERCAAAGRGAACPLQTRYRKFAEQKDGAPRGFNTPTRKIELYSETMLEHGYPPLPEYEEPLVSPLSRPDLAERYPLILTCAKHTLFCESQHRALPSLRRRHGSGGRAAPGTTPRARHPPRRLGAASRRLRAACGRAPS
jgi:anaerobic selenocysteine-containing dehydrogenase